MTGTELSREQVRRRVARDIAHAREVVVPEMVSVLAGMRVDCPELAECDRIGLFVAEVRARAGSLEMAIVLAVLLEDAVDRQSAS